MKKPFQILLISLFALLLSACAIKSKPIEFAPPYQHGQYQIVMLDIQPGKKFKEKVAESEYEAQLFETARQQITNSLMPKLASRPRATPVGLLIYIDSWEMNTLMQGSLRSRLVLWHPETKAKIAEMQTVYSESKDKDSTLGAGPYYIQGGLGGVIAAGLVTAYQGVSKHVKGEDEIKRQINVYTDAVMATLYPNTANTSKNNASSTRNFLIGQ